MVAVEVNDPVCVIVTVGAILAEMLMDDVIAELAVTDTDWLTA
jgi:hypothetical protein